MQLVFFFFLLGVGLALLFYGGHQLVASVSALGRRHNWSPFVMGAVVIGFGTSTPELFTTLQANLSGSAGLALGNVVGSNLANMALVIGIVGLFFPLTLGRGFLRYHCFALTGVTILVAWLIVAIGVSRFMALGLLLLMAGFFASLIIHRSALSWQNVGEQHGLTDRSFFALSGHIVLGLVLLLVGAQLLIEGASGIARLLDVAETLIGLTVLALGTSLPELFAVLASLWQKQEEFVFGNLIGSCFFNFLAILGITALAKPLMAEPSLLFDLLVLLFLMVFWLLRLLGRDVLGFVSSVFLLGFYMLWFGHQAFLSTGFLTFP